jgi:hypothetical protein
VAEVVVAVKASGLAVTLLLWGAIVNRGFWVQAASDRERRVEDATISEIG